MRISDWSSDVCSSDLRRSGGFLMRRLLVPALALMLVGCGGSSDDFRNRPLAANPSAFIAAEIRFAQRAQEEGQWTAFRETAHPAAVMFVPERVKAQDRSEEHTSELQSLMRISYAVFCLKHKKIPKSGYRR